MSEAEFDTELVAMYEAMCVPLVLDVSEDIRADPLPVSLLIILRLL